MAGAERTFTVRMLGDATGAQRAFSDVSGAAEHTESRFSSFASGVGKSLAAAGLAVGGLAAAAVPMIGAASDLAETQAKVGVIFGSAAGEIEAFASTAARSLGQSKQQAMDAAATFATFGKSAGLSGSDLAGFATGLSSLASDLASFNNTSPEEAIQAIGSALRGEAEPMRRYGVLLDDASMRQKAFEMGLISSTKEALEPSQKVLAAQALIMAQTKDAQGDFARTSDGLANKQRILAAQFENVKASIGEQLLPVALRLATFASDTLLPVFQRLSAFLIAHLRPVVAYIARGFAQLAEAFRYARDGGWEAHGIFERVGVVLAQIVNAVKAAVEGFKLAGGGITGVGVAIQNVVTMVLEMFGVSESTAIRWGDRVSGAFHAVVNVAQVVFSWLQRNVPPAVEAVRQAMAVAFGWLQQNIPPAIEAVRRAIEATVGAIVAYWNRHFEDIRAVTMLVFGIVRTIIETSLATIEAFWRTWGGTIIRFVTDTFNAIWQVVQGALDVLRGVMDIVMGLIRGDWGRVWDGIKQIVDGVWQMINGIVDQAINYVRTAIEVGMRVVAGVFDAIWAQIGGIVTIAMRVVLGIITGGMSEVLLFIWKNRDDIIGFFRELPGKLGDVMQGMADIILWPFKTAFNAIANLWNNTVGQLSFEVPGWVPLMGGKGWSVPKIPMLAKGGIVTGPTLAMIGEAGPEAVVPLNRGSVGATYNIVVNALDPKTAGRAVVDAIRSFERANGTGWRAA